MFPLCEVQPTLRAVFRQVPHGSRRGCAAPRRRRRGAALVEFALIALSFYVLFAAAIELGRLMFSAQVLQDCSRTLARELALRPFPPSKTLHTWVDGDGFVRVGTLDEPTVRAYVFDSRRLVVDLETYPFGPALDQYFASGPIVNQMIRSLMVVDRVQVPGGGQRAFLRYPGALVRDSDPENETGLTVMIPHVLERGAQGKETLIRWLPVVEEVRPEGPYDSTSSPYSMQYRIPELAGTVSIRINYPFQAATMVGYTEPPSGPFDPNLGNFIDASGDQTGIPDTGGLPPGSLLPLGGQTGPYAGPYGLGVLLAYGQEVRPFRKLISAQAVFRREVFE